MSKLIVILGTTASGKSALAVALAKRFNGEIISADSRQVYKGMDIGTGKVAGKWQRANGKSVFVYERVKHHLIDFANPKKQYSVAQFQKEGKKIIQKLFAIGHLPIIVGGTGFYIDALLYSYNLPHVPANQKLRRVLEKKSTGELFEKLKSLDPRRAKTIDRHNKRRLVRALEIIQATGKPIQPLNAPKTIYSSILENTRIETDNKKSKQFNVLKIGIKVEPAELKKRIKKRLRERFKQGMIQEIKKLRRNGLSWKKLDSFGLEYRFISRYLREIESNPSTRARDIRARLARAEMIKKLERAIVKYAKRQMTWFKRDKKIVWVADRREAERVARNFISE